MKNIFRKIALVLGCAMLLCICMIPVKAEAAAPRQLTDYATSARTFKVDLTGNGVNNKLTITPVIGACDSIESIRVKIDGKTALNISNLSDSWGYRVNYVKMSGKKIFLQIMTIGSNDHLEMNNVYQYKTSTKKLSRVLKLSGTYAYDIKSFDASRKTITVLHGTQPSEVGSITWKYTYTYKNGAFMLNTPKASVKSSLGNGSYNNDGLNSYFQNNQFVVNRTNLVFYTKPGGTKTAYTAIKYQILTLREITKISGKYYLRFDSGNSTGWIRIFTRNVYDWDSTDPNHNGYFKGVYNRLAG